MKFRSKKLFIVIVVVVVVLCVGKVLYYQYQWHTSSILYAIGFVKGTVVGAGPSREKYTYAIDGIQYSQGRYDLVQGVNYVVEVTSNDKSVSDVIIRVPINLNEITSQPSGGWTECPINEDGTIKEKYKRKNDPWYLKKTRYVVGEAMDTSMRYIYRFKWRYASVPNVEIGKHYMLKINADNLKQYELASTVPIDTAKLQIQTNGGWEECPITKEGVIKDKFKK